MLSAEMAPSLMGSIFTLLMVHRSWILFGNLHHDSTLELNADAHLQGEVLNRAYINPAFFVFSLLKSVAPLLTIYTYTHGLPALHIRTFELSLLCPFQVFHHTSTRPLCCLACATLWGAGTRMKERQRGRDRGRESCFLWPLLKPCRWLPGATFPSIRPKVQLSPGPAKSFA